MIPQKSTAEFGLAGEQATADLLTKQGFMIKDRNYRKQYGEIDIIATKEGLIVFVEVKARRTEYFDSTDLITRSKQQKIVRVAKEYIARNKVADVICRFDVALVIPKNGQPSICYIPNAFVEEE
jgi:putative endonuclease